MSKAEIKITTPDPIAEAGRSIVRLIEALDANETMQSQEGSLGEKVLLCRDHDALNDRLFIIEAVIATGKATTLVGAMAQVLIAMGDADCINSYVEDAKDARECNKLLRRITSALYSVLDVLSEASGVPYTEVGGEYYANPRFNPHSTVQKAMAVHMEVAA